MPVGASPDTMRAASVVTGTILALWLLIGYVPWLRPHATGIRLALLAFYLAAAVGFVLYVTFGGPHV